ncbi:MAG: DEAD/DEAH box helicase [Anaerolineae bacterium]|nr:DEAD/DEAH box helicase [Anaerolineae bacterium]
MPVSVLVTNTPPTTDENVPEPLLAMFRNYTHIVHDQDYAPFSHQAQTFRLIAKDKEVFLVAGTAAGKTLAIAVPLFAKLQAGRIRKVLLMYPTIALMEDQGKVMRELAQITGLAVAQIQGGMPRAKLIAALNKPVILATPDAIHWFFHKNVKYSGLLIYALALVDEYVLDEAHFLNGLMLRNFEHLWRRIQSLAEMLERSPRLHILTATPTDALQRLNNGARVAGKSKCWDVAVELRPCGHFDRSEAMVAAINEALATGGRKVLVVCNSARMAHQLFEKYKDSAAAALPATHRLRFGKVKFGDLFRWLEQSGVESGILDDLSARFFREGDVTLSDLPPGSEVCLPLADIVAGITQVLERQSWRVKRVLWEHTQQPGETWESLLHNRPLPCAIIAALHSRLLNASDLERQQAVVDEWLADTLNKVGVMSEESIRCQAPDFGKLRQALGTGLGQTLAALVVNRLIHEINADPDWTHLPSRSLSHRPIYLHWLDWMISKDQVERIRALVATGLESGALRADCRHIGLWKKTDTPVIVYSGSMAKHARAGLIDVFADLERAVLIATSAVEVGVDFVADTLITEECEGTGFLQRFGRVGRHGDGSQALALVSGDVAARWHALNGQSLCRDDFSARIQATFPERSYAAASSLVDAGHYLVNEQLGRIGTRLNTDPDLVAARPFAEKLRAVEIPVAFGLRNTLPQIALKDGVTKDPFYLLRYVDNSDLRPADSPFVVAQAKTWFTELIFQKARFNVMVDLNATLPASRAWFKMVNGEWRIAEARPGIGAAYAHRLCAYYEQRGDWDPWLPGNCLLLHGDVYLQRADLGLDYPTPEPVCDDEQNPLFIPAQNYLVLLGWDNADRAKTQLAESPIADWEELHYDWDGMAFNRALVLLERTAGACFAAYKEWMDYAGRRLPK